MDSLFLRVTGLALTGLFFSLTLQAAENQITIGANTRLTLPPGWTVIESRRDETAPRAQSASDPNAATLLLAASPEAPTRQASLSIYRINFPTTGPHPLLVQEEGAKMQIEKTLCTVLSQGFTPIEVHQSRPVTEKGTRVLSVEVTAKNAAGNELVFQDVLAGSGAPLVCISSSRALSDQKTGQDIAAIVRSFAMGERQVFGNVIKPTATPDPKDQTASIVSENTETLLMVEGAKGTGSGFICKIDGRTYAITNAHVLRHNPNFKLTNLKSTGLNASAGAISVGHDIVRLEIPNAAKSFELANNLETSVRIGDAVAVLGNAQGAMVVKPVEGKVVGIGPNLVEVDAPFVEGNSGSPIIHIASGKVIGVATYLLERKVSRGESVTVETRRFGYRLDSVRQWEPINWQLFYTQAAQAEKIDVLSNDFIKLFSDGQKGSFDPTNYKTPGMQRAVQSFTSHFQNRSRSINPGERKMYLVQFLSDLRTVSRSDIFGFDSRTAYDYFRREIEEQIKFREELYQNLSRAIENRAF